MVIGFIRLLRIMMMFARQHYKSRTYIMLRSMSFDTKQYAAVIYPFEQNRYKAACLFERPSM